MASVQVTQLHQHIERLCNIKEMRTPVLIRALVRWSCMIVFPVFSGFYAQNLSHVTQLAGMFGTLVVLVSLTIHSVHWLDLSCSMISIGLESCQCHGAAPATDMAWGFSAPLRRRRFKSLPWH